MTRAYKPTTKIFNNGWNQIDRENMMMASITLDPSMDDCYDDATTDDIIDLYIQRRINSVLHDLYTSSIFFEKYNKNVKRIDKSDLYNVYVYFRDKLYIEMPEINIVQIFIGIAEFFELNYDILYNDIISIEDKSKVLECLANVYGVQAKMKCLKLF
jgi:hypothetical protein